MPSSRRRSRRESELDDDDDDEQYPHSPSTAGTSPAPEVTHPFLTRLILQERPEKRQRTRVANGPIQRHDEDDEFELMDVDEDEDDDEEAMREATQRGAEEIRRREEERSQNPNVN
jgi:hypothetical protein